MGTLTKNNNIKIYFWDYLYPPKLGEKLGKINAELDMAEKESKKFSEEINSRKKKNK